MDIQPYLKLMVEKNASDLFFTSDSPVKIKLEGKAVSVGKTELTPELSEAAAHGIMNDRQKAEFEETNECDFAIALPDNSARFRVIRLNWMTCRSLVQRFGSCSIRCFTSRTVTG